MKRARNRRRFGTALLALACTVPFAAADDPGGKTTLTRNYRRGETTVYHTEIHSEAKVRTEPAGLAALLPPLPTRITAHQQNTVTVRAVHRDGGADLENHFDRFEVQSNLPERSPKELRQSAEQSVENFSQRISGKTLVAHYDRQGRLIKLDGTDAMFQSTDWLLRTPLEQVLRVFLEQMGGGLAADHPVKLNDEWSHSFSSPATAQQPWSLEGESTWRYSGETRYGRIPAAIIEFRFSDVVTPALGELKAATPLAQLDPQGTGSNGLSILVRGQGQGRLLVALDTGQVLENQTQSLQTLTATLKGMSAAPATSAPSTGGPSAGAASTSSDPLMVEISSQTTLKMAASQK